MKQHLLRRVERFMDRNSSHRIYNRILHSLLNVLHDANPVYQRTFI